MNESKFIIAALLALMLCSCKDGNAVPSQMGGTESIGENITVSTMAANTSAYLIEKYGVIDIRDGAVHFDPEIVKEDPYVLEDTLDFINTQSETSDFYKGITKIVIGSGTLEVSLENEPTPGYYFNSVSAYGQTIKLDPPVYLPTSQSDLICADGVFILGQSINGYGDFWVLTRDNTFEIRDDPPEHLDYSAQAYLENSSFYN